MRTSYRAAIRRALRELLAADRRVLLIGEDVGAYGGAFAVSHGLLAEFGGDRVRDTPLSEAGFVGAGIGAALGGLRPIVEVMTVNFSLLALDQIVNSAATLRHMSGGQLGVPLVLRMATGAGRQVAAQHSHSFEAWYAHVPGIKVLAPATVADAHGLLLAAAADPDPTVVFEHAALYPMEGELDERAGPAELGRAAVRRIGSQLTVVSYGGSMPKVLEAAERLAPEGIDAEVIDLRTLRPLDLDTVLASVRRTHQALVVDEGWRTGSLAGELAAQIGELAFFDLDGPVRRLCSAEVPIPYARQLEEAALPSVASICRAMREQLAGG